MKSKMFMSLLITLFIATLTVAEMNPGHEMQGSGSKGSAAKLSGGKARCAYDGMLMKASAMVPMKQGEETLYFCNEAQKIRFQKSPKRYLKSVMVGDMHAFMHVLTIKEYKDMMQNMGMGSMVMIQDPNATHYVSVHFADENPRQIGGMAARIAAPDGTVNFRELRYDKMMKSYVGTFPLLKSGKYKLRLLLASNELELP